MIRALLFERGLGAQTVAISNLQNTADGTPDLEQGVVSPNGTTNIKPADAGAIAFGRTSGQVLGIA